MVDLFTRRFCFFMLIFLGVISLSGCAGKKATVEKIPSEPGAVKRSAVVRTASSQLGKPYRYGGNSPGTGFDCSGFTSWVYGQHGVTIPRRSSDQIRVGKKIDSTDLKKADLVFFDVDGKGSLHVGIYIDGKTFIHSPSQGGRVRKEDFSSRYWQKSFLEGRNLLQ